MYKRQNNGFTVDAGESSGIEVGMPIVTSDGLVGKIVLTSKFYSQAMPYFNNLYRVSARIQDKVEFNKWGINKVQSELFKKGISEKDIHLALQEIESSEQIGAIKKLVSRNKQKFLRTESFKRKKKIFDFLLRKGYDSNNILKQMPALLSIIEE